METASSLISSSTLLPFTSSFGSPSLQDTKLRHHKRSILIISFCRKRDAYDRDSGGRLVDENMIVLRKRIHEMKVAEKNYEAPSEWMDWEKRYYASYGSDVSQLMGMLQAFLLNTRPGLALGLVAVITLSAPASVIVIVFHLLKVAMSALAGGGAS